MDIEYIEPHELQTGGPGGNPGGGNPSGPDGVVIPIGIGLAIVGTVMALTVPIATLWRR